MTVFFLKNSYLFLCLKIILYICPIIKYLNVVNLKLFYNMYISSIAIVFSSIDDLSLYTTCISLDHRVGCTLMHALEFLYKNPIVKSYLKNKYYIVSLNFKYSKIAEL